MDIPDATGVLLVTKAGVAGRLTVTNPLFTVPGIVLSGGTISIAINTSTAALLDLPAGPTVTVKAIGASLTFGGNTLSGDFLFDQGNGQTRIAAVNVNAAVAGVTLSAGEGAFLVTQNGIAGQASGTLSAAVGPVSAGGRALLRVNTTGATLDETLTLGNRSIAIKFGEAEKNTFAISVSGLSLDIGGFVTIEGDVAIIGRRLRRRRPDDLPRPRPGQDGQRRDATRWPSAR